MAQGIKRPRVVAGPIKAVNPTSPFISGIAKAAAQVATKVAAMPAPASSGYDALGRKLPTPVAAPAPAPAVAAPAPPPPDPRDADFATSVARLMAQQKQQRASTELQGSQDTEDFATTMARMAQKRSDDLVSTNHNANREGLFYSGILGKRRGDVNTSYDQQQTDQQTAFDRRAQARQAALDQLGEIHADASSPLGYSGTGTSGYDLQDLYSAAVQRAINANQSAPVAFDDPAPTAAPAAAAAVNPNVTRNDAGQVTAVNPAAWVKTTYKNAQGHPVNVFQDGHKEVLVNGVWKRA